tara:strand:- start:729 stop:1454 length:726 start_codon:yes stop_codon:yes gene_type:complete
MPNINIHKIKALTFDIFGTVTDWRSSIYLEGLNLSKHINIPNINWLDFADSWRSQYMPYMNKVRLGELPWTTVDDLHKMILEKLLNDYEINNLNEEEKDNFNKSWHRLKLWPDVIDGLNRIKSKFKIATLSNGNIDLLTNLSENAGIKWDYILSAENSKHYKPDPEIYLKALSILSLKPENVMMIAAHAFDLRAAKDVGMQTAYVLRNLEFGENIKIEEINNSEFDIIANDFQDLAYQLNT